MALVLASTGNADNLVNVQDQMGLKLHKTHQRERHADKDSTCCTADEYAQPNPAVPKSTNVALLLICQKSAALHAF